MSGKRVVGFAHRGAPRSSKERNTLPAFERALSLGAGGLESDISLTADGVPVLYHVSPFARRFAPSRHLLRDLPDDIPTLAALYERCGTDFELSLDMGAPAAAEAVVQTADSFGAAERLWLTYWSLSTLIRWRRRWPNVHLVFPSLALPFGRTERLLERLSAIGPVAFNVFHRTCTDRVVQAAHGRNILTFTWGIRTRAALERTLLRNVDGVYCDNVDAMVTRLSQ